MRQRVATVAVSSIVVLVILAACATNDSRGDTASSQGSAPAASPVTPNRTGPIPVSSGTASCGARVHQLTVDPANPPAPVCLRVGQRLFLTTPSSPHQPWQPFTVTDHRVLTCTTAARGNGAVEGSCVAAGPGTAIISTGTAPLAQDPHGPVQYHWQLSVTVER